MAQHGFAAMFGHHGCLRAGLIGGGVVLTGVVVLVATGTISPLLAAATFAAIAVGGAALTVNVMRLIRTVPSLPAHVRLLDSTATVVITLAPEGRVLAQGENWAATLDDAFADQSIPAGRRVRVVGVENLRLIVTPSVDELLAQARETSG
jgi:membrane-bound ClpP family serine protease